MNSISACWRACLNRCCDENVRVNNVTVELLTVEDMRNTDETLVTQEHSALPCDLTTDPSTVSWLTNYKQQLSQDMEQGVLLGATSSSFEQQQPSPIGSEQVSAQSQAVSEGVGLVASLFAGDSGLLTSEKLSSNMKASKLRTLAMRQTELLVKINQKYVGIVEKHGYGLLTHQHSQELNPSVMLAIRQNDKQAQLVDEIMTSAQKYLNSHPEDVPTTELISKMKGMEQLLKIEKDSLDYLCLRSLCLI